MNTESDCTSTPRTCPCNEKAAVFLNGECDLPPDFFRKTTFYNDFDFFCADGGANIALKFGIIPTAVIGDMDSITHSNRRKLEKLSKFIVYPADKEQSDGELLLDFLEKQGYAMIHIFAATGGRLDQTLFNIQLLQKHEQCRIITKNEEIFFIRSGSVITHKIDCLASLIPTTPKVCGVSLEGFKFNLKSADLNYASTLTLSNMIISDQAYVYYREGGLLLVLAKQPEKGNTSIPGKLKLIKGKRA